MTVIAIIAFTIIFAGLIMAAAVLGGELLVYLIGS